MPRKPRLTAKGLLAESYGRRPYTVTLREEKEPGTNALLDTASDGRRLKASLGYPVRSRSGKGWAWDYRLLERARGAAEAHVNDIRLGHLNKTATDEMITVGTAFALYHDVERGGMPGSHSGIYGHRMARREWCWWLGATLPWNAIKPADVEGLIRHVKEQGMVAKADELFKNLRTVYRWLRFKRGMRHLLDPTETIERRKITAGYKPKRPRYTQEEARKIVAVRDLVDPRFALMIALMDDSGARREALRLTKRSDLDATLEYTPGDLNAPHGWLMLPALKGQERPLVFLTGFQRREVVRALTGYLRELERDWLENGHDYPLFPASKVRGIADETVRPFALTDSTGKRRPAQSKTSEPISQARTREWLIEAEDFAAVPHVPGRGWHGLRRAVSDYLEEMTDLATLTTALGWSNQRTPESIYLDKSRVSRRSAARAAMEVKRAPKGDA